MKKSITVTKNGPRKHLFKIKTYKGYNIFLKPERFHKSNVKLLKVKAE